MRSGVQRQRPARSPQIAAGAGIHRRDELEARRELRLARGARDRDARPTRAARAAPRARRGRTPAARRGTARRGARARSRRGAAARRRPPARRPTRVWCGVRNGRAPQRAASKPPLDDATAPRPPPALRPRVIGGRMPGKRAASIDLPVPGGPTIRSAVAAGRGDLERALRLRLPLDVGEVRIRRRGRARRCRRTAASGASPARCAQTSSRVRAGRMRAPSASAACGALRLGQHERATVARAPTASSPARRAPGAARRTARARRRTRAPPSAARGNLPAGGEDAERDRQVEAADSFGRSAGARLTVMRRAGNSKRVVAAPRARGRAPRSPRRRAGRRCGTRAARSEVHLDRHYGRIDARERAARYDGNRHGLLRFCCEKRGGGGPFTAAAWRLELGDARFELGELRAAPARAASSARRIPRAARGRGARSTRPAARAGSSRCPGPGIAQRALEPAAQVVQQAALDHRPKVPLRGGRTKFGRTRRRRRTRSVRHAAACRFIKLIDQNKVKTRMAR